MRHFFKASSLVLGVSVGLATPPADAEESPVTDFWVEVAAGVADQIDEPVVGWALSAIGLAGDSNEGLDKIESELEAIDQELTDITTELGDLINAVNNLTCVSTQTQDSLTNAVNIIETQFKVYQMDFIQAIQKGDTILQSQLDTWLDTVTDQSEGGVLSALTAINTAVAGNPSENVLLECIPSLTEEWNSGDGPSENIFDDRPYYQTILNIVNYYYGVQAQGAALLSEAYHLQACQEAAKSDPDLYCDFQTESTTTPSTKPYEICNDATGAVATLCLEAQEVVTDPESMDGVYELVTAQMIYAGAPYTTDDEVGLLWGTDLLFVKSLEDFNTDESCPTPLPYSVPSCGNTVGALNLEPTFVQSSVEYANYTWSEAATGPELGQLLIDFNANASGTDTLGDWMSSKAIGFSLPAGKIIITNNATTGNTADFSPSTAICFMDTTIERDQTKQPFCRADASGGTVPENVEYGVWSSLYGRSGCEYTASSNVPVNPWYVLVATATNGRCTEWDISVAAGWLTVNIINEAYYWPRIKVTDLDCSVRTNESKTGYINLGGEYTRCGSDLQAYIDSVLPKPSIGTTSVAASMDATLTQTWYRNDGANPQLTLVRKPGKPSNRLVVSFDKERLDDALEQGELAEARLVLTPNDRSSGRGGHIVVASPISVDFIEGNGNLSEGITGSGLGVTWMCAIDLEIADKHKDCALDWPRPDLPRKGPRVFHEDGRSDPISWDVTEAVHEGVYGWMLLKEHGRNGGSARYYSREGAANERMSALAPRLILEFEPE